VDSAVSGVAQAKRYAVDVPTNLDATITHNLGTLDVLVQVYAKGDGAQVVVDNERTDVNTVTLHFAAVPTSGQYRCVVLA
jgi:hypothetical protein